MKKVLLTALAVMASLSLFAQGSVTMANTSGTRVTVDGVNATANFATVGLYWAPLGTTDESAFQLVAGSQSAVLNGGIFSTGAKNVPAGSGATGIAAGAVCLIEIRGWANAYANYEAAFAAGGYAGKTLPLTADTGDPTTTPAGTPASLVSSGFTGLNLTQVPEPSTIALGVLGLAGLFVLRRRS